MTFACFTPRPKDLVGVTRLLSLWQTDPWPGHLHPGDLGWHSSVGVNQIAQDLRIWEQEREPVAVGMLDGSEVIRLAVAPAVAEDIAVAACIARDLQSEEADLFAGGVDVVEARGATALRAALANAGWVDDEPWIPMSLELAAPLDLARLHAASLRVVEAGPEAAGDWTSVHWSSFKGTPYEDDARARFIARWTEIMTGPFAELAHSLVAYDSDGAPVAVTTVWSAGRGRPGLVEPMGVNRDHHGKGYGVAITLAGAHILKRLGASSVVVAAEASNPAALATYRSAGFSSFGEVTDLKRP